MAMERVAKRVSIGGHNIPEGVIVRRYYRGINNLVNLYVPLCDKWLVVSNTDIGALFVAQGSRLFEIDIFKPDIWNAILTQGNDSQK
jgi:predicted ABC-type ATPase